MCVHAREQHETGEEHQRARCEADDKEENRGRGGHQRLFYQVIIKSVTQETTHQ